MYGFENNPWRCWERTTLAGVLNGPENLLVRLAVYDRRTRIYQSEFRWPALVRLGFNDFAGRYAQIVLRFGEARFSFEACNDGNRTYLIVRCLDAERADELELRLEILYLRDDGGQIVARENEVLARRHGRAWRLWSPSPVAHRVGSALTSPMQRTFVAVVESDSDAGHRPEERTEAERRPGGADSPLTAAERRICGMVAGARAEVHSRFGHVPEEFWWAYAAVVYGIGWNMIWAADRGEPLQVCSRDWCVHGNYGEWVLFNWDTFLLVAAAAEYDSGLAHQIVQPQMDVQTPEGLIPGIATPLGVTADRGMPPVAAYGLWKAYQRSGDVRFVETYYEALCRYHAWWRRNRDGNGDGLLEWGSNPARPAHPQWQAHSFWASRYETGMDNHPMWDAVRFNTESATQEQSDIGLNALHALDSVCLANMAALLGRHEDERKYRSRAADITARIDRELWNDELGLWLSRDWNGAWNYRASPTCFYPLFLPEIDSGHVVRSVQEHLRNPRRFGGRFTMPVSPRDDPAYAEQYYVRGRIWPAQAMLVHAALREARQEQAAEEVARGCLETMRDEWINEGHLHENYHAETADGDDTAESDPLYSFGVMLPLTAWNHLRDRRLNGEEVTADLSVLGDNLDGDQRLRRAVDGWDSGCGNGTVSREPPCPAGEEEIRSTIRT